MSKWAANKKKKILIGFGIVILLIAAYIFYHIENSKVATCFDGIQNGGESGVDCGGSCTRVCIDEVRNLVVWWERPFRVSTGVYNTVAYIENQNLYSGLRSIDYEFRLYDENNVLVSEPVYGSTFIEPNKRTAIFAPGIQTGEKDAYTSFFKIISYQDWQRAPQNFSYTLFEVGDTVLSNQDTAPKISADIENRTFLNFVDVPVVVVVYNEENNAIAASQTYIDELNQGDTETVYYSWPEPFGENVSRIEVIPRVNPFAEYEGVS